MAIHLSFRDVNECFEHYYMPSNWTTKHHSKEGLINHFDTTLVDNNKIVDQHVLARSKFNVPYGEGDKEKIDFIYPLGIDDSTVLDGLPILVFIHGGYWEEGDRSYFHCIAKPYLNRSDVIVAIMGYDLCSDRHKVPDIEEQCVKGFTFLMKRFPKSKWLLSGHSAGGYLAAAMLSYPQFVSRLNAVVLLCGVFEFDGLKYTSIRKAIDLSCLEKQNLLRRSFSTASESSITGESRIKPKVLMYVGGDESPIFHCQSMKMFEKLARDSFDVTFLVVKGEDHFSLIEGMLDQGSVVTHSILRLLDDLSQ